MSEEKIEVGIPLKEEDKFWINKMKEMAANAPKSTEDAAKQLISLVTVIQGIYVAALAFLGIKILPQNSFWTIIFLILPIFLWLLSLFFAIRVFASQSYRYYERSSDSCKSTIDDIADFKYKSMKWSYRFVCLSIAVAAAGVVYLLYCGAVE